MGRNRGKDMSKIRTAENPMLDKRFRHLFFGDLEIGQMIITDKNYYVAMLGKEFLYLKYKYKFNKSKLQIDIMKDYIFIVARNANELKIMKHKEIKIPTVISAPINSIKESDKIILE